MLISAHQGSSGLIRAPRPARRIELHQWQSPVIIRGNQVRGNQGGGHQRDRTCECERDQITLTLSGGSSDGALRGAIRGNQEAIHETHLRGVTIEFNQEAIKRQSRGNQEPIKWQSRVNQEAINETHRHGVTIGFSRRGDTSQSMLLGLCHRFPPRL